jgi:hypothetical protein
MSAVGLGCVKTQKDLVGVEEITGRRLATFGLMRYTISIWRGGLYPTLYSFGRICGVRVEA